LVLQGSTQARLAKPNYVQHQSCVKSKILLVLFQWTRRRNLVKSQNLVSLLSRSKYVCYFLVLRVSAVITGLHMHLDHSENIR
jgi:hypothetical protein